MKRLTRSRTEKMMGGVMGGLGHYFNVDPTIFRLLYALLTLATGVFPGVILYLVAIAIVPEEPYLRVTRDVPDTNEPTEI
jgi:phage shock protein PspC (stress-responsive transcriptional regulator)